MKCSVAEIHVVNRGMKTGTYKLTMKYIHKIIKNSRQPKNHSLLTVLINNVIR